MLKLNISNMLAPSVKDADFTAGELSGFLKKNAELARTQLISDWKSGHVGFADLPANKTLVGECKRAAHASSGFSDLIVCGIGGSDLGAKALIGAMGNAKAGKGRMKVHFLGSTADPEEVTRVLSSVNFKRTLINVVSKSGNTIEPLSVFFILRERLKHALGKKKYGRNIITTTSQSHGILKHLSETQGCRTLLIPENVGGRFSALSPVGIFPAVCAGINADKILQGASKVNQIFSAVKSDKNDICLFSALQYLSLINKNKNITVLMPYTSALIDFGMWFRQLWAESLGKKSLKSGKETGLTPILAYGPEDQHSQLQLWAEGPTDKTFTFLKVRKFRSSLTVPGKLDDMKFLSGVSLETLMSTELEATARSLAEQGRPSSTITLEKINEQTLGALIMFFQWSVMMLSKFMEVDPFSQPGVERSKQLIKKMLSKK